MKSPVFRRQLNGAIVQGAALSVNAVQAFLAPRVLGASSYGVVSAVLTVPLLAQALLEAIIVPLTVRWGADRGREALQRLARLQRDSFVWAAGGVSLSLAVGLFQGLRLRVSGALLLAVTASAFLALAFVTTHLVALGYAREHYVDVARAYGVALLGFLASLPLLVLLGPHGMIVALCVVQVLGILCLARAGLWPVLQPNSTTQGVQLRNSWKRDYLPVLSPRLAQLALNPGTVLVASACMSPADLGAYKVTVSLVAAASYLIPIAPAVLQRSVQQESGAPPLKERTAGLWLLASGFLLSCGLAAAFWRWGPSVRATVLGSWTESWSRFDVIFWSIPFYAVMPALSGYVVGIGRDRELFRGLVLCLLVLGISASASALAPGFTLAAGAFVLWGMLVGVGGFGRTGRRATSLHSH